MHAYVPRALMINMDVYFLAHIGSSLQIHMFPPDRSNRFVYILPHHAAVPRHFLRRRGFDALQQIGTAEFFVRLGPQPVVWEQLYVIQAAQSVQNSPIFRSSSSESLIPGTIGTRTTSRRFPSIPLVFCRFCKIRLLSTPQYCLCRRLSASLMST